MAIANKIKTTPTVINIILSTFSAVKKSVGVREATGEDGASWTLSWVA